MAVRRPAAKTAERASVRPRSPLEWDGARGGRGGRGPRARGAWSTRARSRFAGDSFRTRAAPRGRAIARDRDGASRWRRGILGRVCHAVWGERTLRASSRRSATSPSPAKVLTERTDLTGCARDWGWGRGQRPPRRARATAEERAATARIRAETGRGRRNRSHQTLVRGRTLATEAERAATLRAETRATGAATRRADTVTAAILGESERVRFRVASGRGDGAHSRSEAATSVTQKQREAKG